MNDKTARCVPTMHVAKAKSPDIFKYTVNVPSTPAIKMGYFKIFVTTQSFMQIAIIR